MKKTLKRIPFRYVRVAIIDGDPVLEGSHDNKTFERVGQGINTRAKNTLRRILHKVAFVKGWSVHDVIRMEAKSKKTANELCELLWLDDLDYIHARVSEEIPPKWKS